MSDARATGDDTATSAAVALPLLGWFLLMPPIITLFASGAGVGGVPLIVIYLFAVWAGLIASAALLASRLRPQSPPAAAGESTATPFRAP